MVSTDACLGGMKAETQEKERRTKEAYVGSTDACLGGLIAETQEEGGQTKEIGRAS